MQPSVLGPPPVTGGYISQERQEDIGYSYKAWNVKYKQSLLDTDLTVRCSHCLVWRELTEHITREESRADCGLRLSPAGQGTFSPLLQAGAQTLMWSHLCHATPTQLSLGTFEIYRTVFLEMLYIL